MMATTAARVESGMGKRAKTRIGDTVHGSRTLKGAEGEALRLNVSRGMRERQEWEEHLQTLARRPKRDESAAMRSAMQSVERRIVRGLWVLELALPADGPRHQAKHGIDYMNDRLDVDARYSDAAGGKWEAPPPRPAVPSNREIDSAKEAKGWIEALPDEQARFLIVAAMTKRGDRERRVQWERVTSRLPQLRHCPLRTLRDRYDQALRSIVAELTLRTIEK